MGRSGKGTEGKGRVRGTQEQKCDGTFIGEKDGEGWGKKRGEKGSMELVEAEEGESRVVEGYEYTVESSGESKS